MCAFRTTAALLARLKADRPLGCKWGPLIPVPVQIHSEVLSRLAWLPAPRTVMDELTQRFAVSPPPAPAIKHAAAQAAFFASPAGERAGVRVHSLMRNLWRFFSGFYTFTVPF